VYVHIRELPTHCYVLYQSIKDGGLKAVNMTRYMRALQLMWSKLMIDESKRTWKHTLQGKLGRFKLQDALRTSVDRGAFSNLSVLSVYAYVIDAPRKMKT